MNHASLRAIVAVPAINSTMEPELTALCPELTPFGLARVPLPEGGLTADTLPTYTRSTFDAIEPFLPSSPEVLVYGCTAAGFLLGRVESERITAALGRHSGAVVVSTGQAMVDVLRHEGVTETAVVTPYPKPINDGLRAYLASAGFAIQTLGGVECADGEALCRIGEDQVLDMATRTVTPDSKALFIACSQLPTMGILAPLRQRLGIPVWSSVSATAWAAAKVMGARADA
jgi:arylmalonate decarboxylase